MNNAFSIGIALILMGSGAALIALYFWRTESVFRSSGVDADGFIIKKFRKGGDRFLLGIENYFVTVEFVASQGVKRRIDVRAPSHQWHLLREGEHFPLVYLPLDPVRARLVSRTGEQLIGLICIMVMALGVFMALGGGFFLSIGLRGGTLDSGTALVSKPTQFGKEGVERVAMEVSPQHDRVAILDEAGKNLRVRHLSTGAMIAGARGTAWRLLGWRSDGLRIAVEQAGAPVVMDSSTLKPVAGEVYSWAPAPIDRAACPEAGQPVWDVAGRMAAAPCGNDVLLAPASVRLKGHTDRVLAVAWSPSGRLLASVSDDNYVRVWDAESRRCIALSEDYPYPRAIFFSGETTVEVVDVALRRYSMKAAP